MNTTYMILGIYTEQVEVLKSKLFEAEQKIKTLEKEIEALKREHKND